MSANYEAMWKELNLDIPAHDGLLAVLGQFYGDIYLSQTGRLKGAEYLDFVLSEVHGLRIQELMEAKKAGRKVVGTFCVFVPEEIIVAADGVCVGLCAGAEAGMDKAEEVLPRNTCALIKSFMGFKMAGLCPYIESSDLVVGETTCDGKKKAYEALSDICPTYVMEVPHMKEERDRVMWRSEIERFIKKMEELSGKKITAEKLAAGIKLVNDKRRVLQRLNRLRKSLPVPISGRDALLINQISFYDDPPRFIQKMNELCDEIEGRISRGEGVAAKDTPRLMLAGCPMAVPNWKMPFVIESSGAVIVGEESCIGTRNTRDLVDESGSTLDGMIDAIADRYMKIDCACFTPNHERLEHIVEMAKDLEVDGVIHYALQFCAPYTSEAFKVEKALKDAGVPMLKIETDYSMEDMQVLKTRVEAFIEIIKK